MFCIKSSGLTVDISLERGNSRHSCGLCFGMYALVVRRDDRYGRMIRGAIGSAVHHHRASKVSGPTGSLCNPPNAHDAALPGDAKSTGAEYSMARRGMH